MAHELDLREDGTARMFSGEDKTPWHGLGKVVKGLATAKEALEWAGLDWTVEKQPIYFGKDKELYSGRHATVRTLDGKALGIVSDGYHIFQNAEAFEFFDTVTDAGSGDAHYTTAGSLFGGQRVFMTAQIGDTFNVAGEDAHNMYLLITNSHDGTQALTASITTIRAVCNNTVTLALNSAKTQWSLRHKSSLQGKAEEARKSLQMSFKYEDAFQKAVEDMMKIQVTKDQFNKIVEGIVPESKFQHDKAVTGLMDVFENERTVNDTNAKGTAWGAYNAVTYWTDWVRKYQTEDSRFKSLVAKGFGETLRNKAHKQLLAIG